MRYLDTGTRDRGETLFAWLEAVMPRATYFGCQTGYFSYDGIFPLENQFLEVLNRPGPVRLVVGANESGVRKADLEDVLDLFGRAPANTEASLVLVAADDVLMHPKTYYVEWGDGSKHALIGSANFTHSGLGRNIEAAVVLDSRDDPAAPFDEIRDAIEKWHLAPHKNAHQVSRANLGQLATDGLIDRPARPRAPLSPVTRQSRARTFPPLGAIISLRRKRRPVALAAAVAQPVAAIRPPLGALQPLPDGADGIIKRLTRLDTKGFRGESGTPYIALPKELADFLPMVPSGRNGEPRVDVNVEMRLDTAPRDVVTSGDSPTNVTHVGVGENRNSHGDLRFNYLTTVKRGIENLAVEQQVALPVEGDLVAIEFVAGVTVRVTFITEAATIQDLEPLLDRHGNSWGWLQAEAIAPWDDDEDDA